MSACVPEPVQQLLVQLEFLALIEKNLKPNMGDMTFSDSNSYLDSLWRMLRREGREKNMVFLEEVVKNALSLFEESRDEEWHHLLGDALSRARDGIRNLLVTYDNRPKVKAQVLVLLNMIDLRLNESRPSLRGTDGALPL